MKTQAYHDGYETGKRMGGDLRVLERAIADCEEMGWFFLLAYFRGKADAIRDAEGIAPTGAGKE